MAQASAPPAEALAELMSDASPQSDTGGVIVGMPVFETALPASVTWRLRFQRGLLSGEAVMDWALQADQQYTLTLDGALTRAPRSLYWRSRGVVGPFGVSPTRFVVLRKSSEVAANFNDQTREISFSSSTNRLPWVNGVQDRLSWMIQLPAIVRARPEQYAEGAALELMVVGAGGGAELWRFQVEGMDSLEGTPALKMLRVPTKPWGTKVQVWLDPARQHQLLRVILTQGESAQPLQLDFLPSS
jgi:hypothetical protein